MTKLLLAQASGDGQRGGSDPQQLGVADVGETVGATRGMHDVEAEGQVQVTQTGQHDDDRVFSRPAPSSGRAAVAASYGQIAAAIVGAGRQPRARSMDLLIAATAHAHSARLYTRNIDDFRGLDNLVEVLEA